MLCEKPFVKRPTGISKKALLLSEEARLAATPFGCGRCLPCRINKSRVWQHRLMLESMAHEKTCFVTLTYDNEHLPKDRGLVPDDPKNFLKRLRYYLCGIKVRYFTVGEYGDKFGRPHYHLALFGIGIGQQAELEKAWPQGIVHIGEVNKDSISYLCGYVVKGMTNKKRMRSKKHPEFMRCSKMNGGIGYPAIEQIAKKIEGKDIGTVQVLRHGKRLLPLGRYLTYKLQSLRGRSESEVKEKFYEWQEAFHVEHSGKTLPIDSYLESVVGSIRRKKRLNHLFKKRESL